MRDARANAALRLDLSVDLVPRLAASGRGVPRYALPLGSRAVLVAFLLAAVAAGCSDAPTPTPDPTPRGTISPDAGLNAAEQLLIQRLPAWVDRGQCTSGLKSGASKVWAASLICRWDYIIGLAPPASLVAIGQLKVPETGDEFLVGNRAAWRVNFPDVTPAPGCAEGPWIGRWDVDGEVVGVLVCTGQPGHFDYHWLDERTGLYGSAVFSSRTWADAYRSWRQSGLTDMTSPQ